MNEIRQNQTITSDSWYFPGSTILTSIMGNISLADSKISFVDDEGHTLFQLELDSIDKVDFMPAMMTITTKTSEKYKISFMVGPIGLFGLFQRVSDVHGIKKAREWEEMLAKWLTVVPWQKNHRVTMKIFYGAILVSVALTLVAIIITSVMS